MEDFWPCNASFSSPTRWKSDGATSGLYGGCLRLSNFMLSNVLTVWAYTIVKQQKLFKSSLQHFSQIASSNLLHSMSMYWTLWRSVIGVPPTWKQTSIGLAESQKLLTLLPLLRAEIWTFWWLERMCAFIPLFVSCSQAHCRVPRSHLQLLCDSEKHLYHHGTTPNDCCWLPNVHSYVPVSCFGINLVQMLWYTSSSWMIL